VACTAPTSPKRPFEKAGRAPLSRQSANGDDHGGTIVKTDRDLIIHAVEEAQRILDAYFEPGTLRSALVRSISLRPCLIGPNWSQHWSA
jgi:hypothetical protein